MNLRVIVLGRELLRLTTDDIEDEPADDYDGSGYTTSTPIGYAPSQATGWDTPLHQPWADE